MSTGFVYDSRFLTHKTHAGHPERSDRLRAVMGALERQPWFGDLRQITPRIAERRWLEHVHESAYIARASEACRSGQAFLDVPDVSISHDSSDVAALCVGGALALADQLIAGEIDNGFGLVRPPGHHAERSLALGFCLFNTVAVLARYLQKQHGLDKILIFDWDVHHGNGTQHAFEEDPSVLYVSLHQYPFYPGTGAVSETGIGRGAGATLNCPMPAGATDADYERAFRERILPKLDAFRPEAVLISAGFDAHVSDPLAQVCLSSEFFRWMGQRLMECADRHANGRIISLLEGGYDLETLAECVTDHVALLAGATGASGQPPGANHSGSGG